MSGLYEDIDEDLDELDDEGDEDSLSERRRRQPKGGGYTSPRGDKSAVSQSQMQAALARVGADVKRLAQNQRVAEKRLEKTRSDQQQFMQMALLLPLLNKPKTVTPTNLATNGIPADTKLLVESNDSLSMLLPFMLMGGMGGSSSSSSSSGGFGSGDNMMMLALVLLMGK